MSSGELESAVLVMVENQSFPAFGLMTRPAVRCSLAGKLSCMNFLMARGAVPQQPLELSHRLTVHPLRAMARFAIDDFVPPCQREPGSRVIEAPGLPITCDMTRSATLIFHFSSELSAVFILVTRFASDICEAEGRAFRFGAPMT